MIRIFRPASLFFCLLLTGLSVAPAAQEATAPGTSHQLETIAVRGSIENRATGLSVIPRDVIPRLPRGNGSITELLEVLPDVQVDRSLDNSLTGGEILPPEVSISGGKAFQNNFTIDGFSNNSLLDPTLKDPNDLDDVPGHSQELFLDSDLVESISVYDSNVPARFGNFTGGVVEVATRNPGPGFGGKIAYRHTRDAWTEFHLSNDDRFVFSEGTNPKKQPRFKKHDAGLELNLPLGSDQGVLAAYRILASDIPLINLGETQNQSRTRQNVFLKYVNALSDDRVLELKGLATPYRSEHFIADARDSKFVVDGGGYSLNAALLQAFPDWELGLRGGYQFSENSREAPHIWRPWATLGSTAWGRVIDSDSSNEGGFGDIEKTQQSVTLAADLSGYPLATAAGVHQWSAGLDFAHIRGRYHRQEAAVVHRSPFFADTVICNENVVDCIDGEQFFTRRNIYAAGETDATLQRVALYADDQVTLGALSLRPGVRLSYDDFMENLNLAPRFAGTLDLFDNGRTLVTFGLNRYYGQTLLTYKLREAIQPFIPQDRTLGVTVPTPSDWENSATDLRQVSRFSRLDTPYSDEAAIGVDQALLGGRLSLKFVYREGRDEFAKRFGDLALGGIRSYTLSNRGRSRHRSLRATWERSWRRHFLSLNATWRRTETSNADFDAVVEEEAADDRVWYRGRIVFRDELPKDENELPMEARLTWIAELPWGLTFTNLTTYRSRYKSLENLQIQEELPAGVKEDPESLESISVYDAVEFSEVWKFDWKLSWETAAFRHQRLRLNLEIDNVFNEKIETSRALLRYETGRQFWAGLEYRF